MRTHLTGRGLFNPSFGAYGQRIWGQRRRPEDNFIDQRESTLFKRQWAAWKVRTRPPCLAERLLVSWGRLRGGLRQSYLIDRLRFYGCSGSVHAVTHNACRKTWAGGGEDHNANLFCDRVNRPRSFSECLVWVPFGQASALGISQLCLLVSGKKWVSTCLERLTAPPLSLPAAHIFFYCVL